MMNRLKKLAATTSIAALAFAAVACDVEPGELDDPGMEQPLEQPVG